MLTAAEFRAILMENEPTMAYRHAVQAAVWAMRAGDAKWAEVCAQVARELLQEQGHKVRSAVFGGAEPRPGEYPDQVNAFIQAHRRWQAVQPPRPLAPLPADLESLFTPESLKEAKERAEHYKTLSRETFMSVMVQIKNAAEEKPRECWFFAGQPVALANGSVKPAAELRLGDRLQEGVVAGGPGDVVATNHPDDAM